MTWEKVSLFSLKIQTRSFAHKKPPAEFPNCLPHFRINSTTLLRTDLDTPINSRDIYRSYNQHVQYKLSMAFYYLSVGHKTTLKL